MSARAVKRLLAQQQLKAGPEQAVNEDLEESSEEEPAGAVRNPFDLLGDEDEAGVADEEAEASDEETGPPLALVEQPRSSAKGKKKKKKKAKGVADSGATDVTPPSPETTATSSESAGHVTPDVAGSNTRGRSKGKGKVREDEEVEEILRKLDELPVGGEAPETAGRSTEASRPRSNRHVLGVDVKHLKAEDELRRIFGSKVISSVEAHEGAGARGGGGRRHRLSGRGRGRGAVGPRKGGLLISPLDHWPRWDGGILMESMGSKDGCQFFKYTFSRDYLRTQHEFEALAATHDPNAIAHLVAQHPYHIDGLLTLADVYKQMGEMQTVAELLERCLYAFECAWHPSFNISLGTCRVPFEEEPNRAFYQALFRHMQHLGRRGCHRTALEVCKLVLSLDPEGDPAGALFCVDYYALRSEQFDYLERLADELDAERSLRVLPNFAFSLAMARFRLEERQKSSKGASTSGNDAHGAENGGGGVTSLQLLEQALLLHPAMLQKLIEKTPIKEDSEWAKLLNAPVFAKATAGGPTLEHLIDIYLERSHLLWRPQEAQDWLKQAAKNAVASLSTPTGKAAADDWACVRSESFPSTENEYAYLPVSEFSDNTHTLPPDEEAAGAPLPVNPAELPGAVDVQARGVPPGALPAELDGQNPLMLFLRSLMPWADLGLEPQHGGGENGNGVQLNEEQLEQVQLHLQREAYEQAQAEAERRGWARGQRNVQGLGQGLGRRAPGREQQGNGGQWVDGIVESDDEE
ncbi:hypothetical protein KFL_001440300 [Klebsormidium nitens]|uniref:Transcription factor 25 n=1 Tax=Klebsormidium nitens TaxID=105231 RepID=A0A1Y1HYS6_KLENI|nr:hypothetical protein KFL_001440300 [Klebsormidium nitens]|eukprot:GAQ83343.1 hypothetical protein KFL_001440300 [Klebsormidium nitens]